MNHRITMLRNRLADGPVRSRLLLLLAAGLMLLPVGGLSLWRHVYGFTGDLAPATWVLFFVWFGFPGVFQQWVSIELPFRRRLLLLVSLVLFYVLALGSGPVDPYAYGFQPRLLLLILALWVMLRGRVLPGLTLLLALALAVFGIHGLTSDNLFDYLFDPVLTIVLGISVFRGVMSRRFSSSA
ncbi:MAG: hypothetical protein FGM35_03385 [Rhodocyclaceae bacterium]|jgi:hypothetical protein|nr:hypothetical protein [Rhodocyclaceae bacterium]